MKSDKQFKVILWVFSIIFIITQYFALKDDSHFKYGFYFVMAFLFGIYHFRKLLHLTWFHFLLFSLFLLSHQLGIFGFYDLSSLGLDYDHWVHGYFGAIMAMMLLNVLNVKNGFRKINFLIVIIFILGISSLHELYEFMGAMVFGNGDPTYIGAGSIDVWDTQKDMLNNVIGGIIGLIVPSKKKKSNKE